MQTRAREISFWRSLRVTSPRNFVRARMCISPAPQSRSPKLETTRSLLFFGIDLKKLCFFCLQKLTRRTIALEHVKKWDQNEKGEVAEVLTEQFMSSEESENEEDDKVIYVVKTIPWESEKLKKRKKRLDKEYNKTQTKCQNKRSVKRVRREGVSSRTKPEDCPDWACV